MTIAECRIPCLEIKTFFTFKQIEQMLMFGWTEEQIIQLYEAGIFYKDVSYLQGRYFRFQMDIALNVYNLGTWAKTELYRRYIRRTYAKRI